MANPPGHVPAEIEARRAELQPKCFSLRKQGFSYRQIGQALDIDHTTAWRWCQAVFAELATEAHEEADEMRAVEGARLDDILVKLSQRLSPKRGELKTGELLAVVDRLIRVGESRRVLYGLNAPTQHRFAALDDAALLQAAQKAMQDVGMDLSDLDESA